MTDTKPSKSARKRQFTELQQLGERLIDLTDEQLTSIVDDQRLAEVIREARSISAHGALRRHKQLIGKIMRDIDPEPIQSAVEALNRQSRDESRIFKEAEQWRERLCANNGAVSDFEAMTGAGHAALRQLLSEYGRVTQDTLRKAKYRQIFREIHRVLLSRMRSTAY